ncbi:hypothetical protein B9Y75_01325 [Stenotrophomonas maltophilia]|nr:hypothetical protein B9Y75_01325 [Stenotrophomonas maltophilia]
MTSRTLPWLITRDTVIGETPARAATSSIVTPAVLRRTDFFGLSNARSLCSWWRCRAGAKDDDALSRART